MEVELQEIKQCVKEGDSLANKKISCCQAIQERTFRIPLATFATIFLLLGICGNDTMVFYGPTIAAQVEKIDIVLNSFNSQVDVGVSTEWLAILPWIGFSAGYALSSPLMAKLVTPSVSYHVTLFLVSIFSVNCKLSGIWDLSNLARLGRVTQFVSFALLMSTSLFALATATHLLSWGWDSAALQVFKLHPLNTSEFMSQTFLIKLQA